MEMSLEKSPKSANNGRKIVTRTPGSILTISLLLLSLITLNQLSPMLEQYSANARIDDPSPMILPLSSSSPSMATASTASTASTSCQKLPISKISASGSDTGYPPSNAIDNNLNTRWSKQGKGSWIQTDLGTKMTICSVDVDWYRGSVRQYYFVISVSNDGSSFSNVYSGKSVRTSGYQTYTLPSDTNARYVRITVNGNTMNSWASIYELHVNGYQSITTPPPNNLYDDFQDGTYTISNGQTSPNGKWLDIYNGLGAAGVKDDGTGTGNNVFYMYPATSTSLSDTEASLKTSTKTWSNFDMSIDVKTVKQLRQNDPPNDWEAAWVFFRYTDTYHFYAFLVRPDGIELEKKDCNSCTDSVQGQKYLVTESSPAVNLKVGSWSNWKISAIGNHIIITVDGIKVVDYVDQSMSPQLSSGSIAMYSEDASAQYDNVYVTPR